jgi:enamine deaminase RidA (YjgF/YER057c/UK114 family)
MSETILPDGWPRPSGYSEGLKAGGDVLMAAGQVGWDPRTHVFESDDFVAQVRQALQNVKDVLGAAGARTAHVVRMTWYITDRDDYVLRLEEVGKAYREVFGAHYPAMSLVIVAGLLEPGAKVEIEATAVLPE